MKYSRAINLFMIILALAIGIVHESAGARVNYLRTPTPINPIDLRVFPNNLMCSDKTTNGGEGPTWLNITIGESTLSDLEEQLQMLSNDYVPAYQEDGSLLFSLTNYSLIDIDIPIGVSVCLNDEIVEVLGIGFVGAAHHYLNDLVADYGVPESVTWSNLGPYARLMFWFTKGIATEVYIVEGDREFGRISMLVYFPFQDADGYENRWPYNRTRKFNPFLPAPEDPNTDFGPENPFDFDAMIATITAQPTRTSTPTLALQTPTRTPIPASSTQTSIP